MVRFGWPGKTTKYSAPSPETNTYTPPRYQEERHASTVPFPSTTNTTTNTTQTTHFLSLPISRKRQEQRVHLPQRLSMHDMRPYQERLDHQRSPGTSSPREKSLPPTPGSSNEDVRVNHIRRTESSISIENQSLSHRPSNQFHLPTTASPPARPSPSQAKLALAQAALAIGLPHGMPQASASSSRSDVTSTAFLSVPQPPVPSSGVRRAKSLHQLSRTFRRDDNDNAYSSLERQRTRRTSFGPSSALDSEGSGGRNTIEGIPSHITPPRKSLVRKASFWNRKHNDLLKPAVAPPPDPPRNSFERLSHVLPSLPPLTPLRFDTSILCSSHSPPQTEEHLPPSPPGLNRYSESRNRPLSPSFAASSSPDLSVQALQTQSSGRRRPLTAGSADDRLRTLSYVHPPDHSSPLAPVPTPPQNPDVATPRRTARPRSQTNPAALLHRLSANIFSFSSSTLSSPTSGTNRAHANHSPRDLPRVSTSRLPPPKPRPEEESPVDYVNRLLSTIGKADVASVLASSGESFYTNALQTYIDRFDFDGDPLDVALRKLLMDVGLPRETQQIDRVMETFANRYLMCNRNLFISDDHPYILAFSLIMLHTDAFNKSNKRKMTKADYIKNTQLDGIYPEVLEYYYDNIVFAPFIFVEDPVEGNLQRNLDRAPSRSLSMFPSQSLPGNSSTVTLLGKTDKIDPYFLIVKDLLDPLRVNVEQYIPFKNRYSYKDNSGVWDEENMHKIFINARVIEVIGSDRRMSTLGFALNFGATGASTTYSPEQGSVLRVVKVGLLHRRDTSLDIGKRVKAGKWRLWSVILTNSQLLFFRDQAWATSLQEQMRYRDKRILVPPVPLLKPDEVQSLKDTVALHDRFHDKDSSFLLISGDRRPFLLQASGEDVSSWVSCINYASAFKTTGVSMRAPGMSGKDVELMGVAAAASHLRDIQFASSDSHSSRTCALSRNSGDHIDRLSSSSNASYTISGSQRSKIINGHEDMDLDVPSAQNNVSAHQLEATFHQVKAHLAAGRWTPPGAPIARPDGPLRAHSLECVVQSSSTSFPEDSECNRASVRTRVIQARLAELDSKIHSLQLQEETDLRLLRNIAVLTPFQRATRGRLGMIILQTSRRIQTTRLVLGMQLCHKEVLSNDLIAQEREWRRAKTIALKAATDKLQSQRESSIPRILPPSLDQPMINSSGDLRHSPEGIHPPESSIAESFHSALDFDWTASATEEGLDSPIVSVRSSTPTDKPRPLSPARTAEGTATPEPGSSHETSTPQEEPDEEAEQWDKTRAAKRVSLVRMPSTLNVSLGRLGSDSGTGSVWIARSPRHKPEP